ncbi:NAD(P)H-dependent glycerol-3-phosphate dehydrogenase [Dinghuibacter silviterrae]|uniref:Glycerol-3-phosphate dehydrogenase [NAD(P)+] n=1 Tax=Dinghuibacter silviterrae TaxID=1539049 RepID=A0A4R8DQL8_9BACT|nr:NAD(P)H-dependent glycerol-3-phosphate dehydrogenase [Dinghuibacter silviterrae]TDX00086.1 glycerol-3-phosphate dehydrogenase (NAD(P)+) [Dinghuibacter silviterrae]
MSQEPSIGLIGSGSWATALAKILTDKGNPLRWWIRSAASVQHFLQRRHNPAYLSSVNFDTSLLTLDTDVSVIVRDADLVVLAVPSAYMEETLSVLPADAFRGKKVISAVKGILPVGHRLLNDYLEERFHVPLSDYFTIMGPCHAEEVAAEKLSYLTFSGIDPAATARIAQRFNTPYLNTVVNDDVYGVQYAAVLKNIYALGAGIAHGLEYGDNFLSVLIANSADEMASFLRRVGARNMEVGVHHLIPGVSQSPLRKTANYAASVYLGDLLVTCYSLYSRNRTFGNMIGKGYSVRAAQLEMNMVAEGYNASRSLFEINKEIGADMPIASAVYRILWEGLPPGEAFRRMEGGLI